VSSAFIPPNKEALLVKYSKLIPLYERLIVEICFILEERLNKETIRIHGIHHRVKDFESFYQKLVANRIVDKPFESINDIAGIRIVCLYRKDLEEIGKIIFKHLEVTESDIKTKALKETEFGYLSDHYIVRLPKSCKGPRYDEIKPLKCEIQVRTILMDAWDSVSHHLDYKQEIDIPSSLRRDFYALSGLFYVADSHFQMFKDSVAELKSHLREDVEKDQFDLTQEMNLTTLQAYLEWKFPDREKSSQTEYSKLLLELKNTGYQQFKKLDEALEKAFRVAELYEKENPPIKRLGEGKSVEIRYSDVGFVRACLELLDPTFGKYFRKSLPKKLADLVEKTLSKYRAMFEQGN